MKKSNYDPIPTSSSKEDKLRLTHMSASFLDLYSLSKGIFTDGGSDAKGYYIDLYDDADLKEPIVSFSGSLQNSVLLWQRWLQRHEGLKDEMDEDAMIDMVERIKKGPSL